MVWGVLYLFLGFSASYFVFSDVIRKPTALKLLSIVPAVFLVLVTVLSSLFGFVGLSLTPKLFMLFFAAIIIIQYLRGVRPKKLGFNRGDTLAGLLVFSVCLIANTLPALPSLTPLSLAADSANHYLLVEYIASNERIPSLERGITEYLIANRAPFGFHAFVAVLSNGFNVSPYYIIYPILILVTALTVLALYLLARELGFAKRIALAAGFYATNSLYLSTALSWSGYWNQVFGSYLFVVFLTLLLYYLRAPTKSVLYLSALFSGSICVVFYLWSVFPPMVFAFVLLSLRIPWDDRVKSYLVFGVIAVVSASTVLIRILPEVYGYTTGISGGVMNTGFATKVGLFNLGFLCLAIPGLYVSARDRRNKLINIFTVSAAVALILFYMGFSLFGFQSMGYSFYKVFYLLVFAAAIYFGETLSLVIATVERYFDTRTRNAQAIYILLLVCGSALFYHGISQLPNHKPALPEDAAAAAFWVRENTPHKEIGIVGEFKEARWFHALSGKTLSTPDDAYIVDERGNRHMREMFYLGAVPRAYFLEWFTFSGRGDVIAVLGPSEYGLDQGREGLKIIKRDESVIVFEKQ